MELKDLGSAAARPSEPAGPSEETPTLPARSRSNTRSRSNRKAPADEVQHKSVSPQLDGAWHAASQSRCGRRDLAGIAASQSPSSAPGARTRSHNLRSSPATVQASADKIKTWRREYGGDVLTIDPRRARWLPYWDVVMTFALLFTAIVTPFEVTFLQERNCITVLFVTNRVIDFCFLLDIVVLFNLQVMCIACSSVHPMHVYYTCASG